MHDLIRTAACIAAYGVIGLSVAFLAWAAVWVTWAVTHG